MQYNYNTRGTCSTHIQFDLEDGVVKNVRFINGCNGNLQAIGKLVEGLKAEEVMEKLRGISCGGRPTSCGDQLARALALAIEQEESRRI